MVVPGEHRSKLEFFYAGRRVCITGGAGFIGSHLARALYDLGARVVVIDDLSGADGAAIDDLLRADADRFQFIHGSILDPRALQDSLLAAKIVFHLAAMVSVVESFERSERAFEVNVLGALRTVELARSLGVERVVAASSSSVYGDMTGPAREDAAPAPLSPYAVTKVATEHIVSTWARTLGLPGCALRFFNVYGPGQNERGPYAAVIPAFVSRARGGDAPVIFGDGAQTRDFIHVDDVVLALLLAGMSPDAGRGDAVNIGSGKPTSILDLAEAVIDLAGHPDMEIRHETAREGEPRESVADVSRARRLLGFQATVDLETGLRALLEQDRSTAAP